MKENLCIPIYLNEKVVFDLLAIIEDGFSHINEVKTSISNQNNIDGQLDSSFKSTGLLSSLFGVTFSGKVGSQTNNLENEENRKEKIHTNVSLFSKLRKTLIETNSLEILSESKGDINNITVGDFVEIEGVMTKNPMIETMETFMDAFNMALSFSEDSTLGNKKNSKKQYSEEVAIFNQIKTLYEDLIKSNTLDLMLSINGESTNKALLSAQLNYFINGFESELIDGEYKVLGKVIKVINAKDSINLFRKTSFKIFQETVIDNLIDSMNGMNDNQGIKLQPIISNVKGPGIIVIPIAIYI